MPTPEQLENRFMSDVLRHVVCDCGNYRHHGVHWMPDGSGEGKKEALELMRNYFANAVKCSEIWSQLHTTLRRLNRRSERRKPNSPQPVPTY